MSSILAGLPAGKVVLHTIENARAEAAAAEWRTDETVEIVIKRFGLASNAPAISAFRKFVANWQQKAMTVSGRLSEFLEYMKYFREASGVVPFDEVVDEADGSAVALMTVHAAKGLEFDHVFVIRANTSSFPTTYKEKLFEMPRALRDPHCLVQTDGPELHKQEERRLFYVAMTRARDALTLYNKPKGVRNPRPSGFIRELMDSPTAQPSWRVRSAETTVELQAAAANVSPVSIGRWLLLGPSTRVLDGALSATAVESYEMCPLRFKIQRDWNIPGEIAASLQFGAAMHDTLKDFFDATCQDRPRSCDQVFQIFKQALADRYFDDEHQRDLYRQQGLMQLEQFLNSYSRNRAPDVLSTERTFELLVDGVRVRGRIDRMDRIHGDCIAIIDYKSGAPKTETDARKSLQLSIYAMAAHELWKLLPTRLIYYNLDNSEEVVATRNENELQEARDRILSVARRIAAGEFEPNPGFHCRSCPYSAMCPATEERLYTTPKNPGRSN
jgi:RecB family exonuclease